MEKTRTSLDEFIHTYPTLAAQAEQYAQETIQDPESHEDAVRSCYVDFMEGARAALSSTSKVS